MSSASSADPLAAYLAGEMTAEQFVVAVTAEYYRGTRNGKRETLRPIMDVIESAHPGVVELKASEAGPGFDVQVAGRPFPKRHETDLRRAVERVVGTLPVSRSPFPAARAPKVALFTRIVAAVRKLFSA